MSQSASIWNQTLKKKYTDIWNYSKSDISQCCQFIMMLKKNKRTATQFQSHLPWTMISTWTCNHCDSVACCHDSKTRAQVFCHQPGPLTQNYGKLSNKRGTKLHDILVLRCSYRCPSVINTGASIAAGLTTSLTEITMSFEIYFSALWTSDKNGFSWLLC